MPVFPGVKAEGTLKKLQLRSLGASEGSRGQLRARGIQAGFAAAHFEQLGDVLSVNSLTAHARAKIGIVQTAAPHVANPVEDLLFLQGPVHGQPFLEKRGHSVGQAQGNESGDPGPGGSHR